MEWRTLIYQIPREPQKNRMAVWRKLKSLGALNAFQTIWILPESEESKLEFQKLEEQINNFGGNGISCITYIDNENKNKDLINQFNNEREKDYEELLEKCEDFEKEILKETKKENFTYTEIEENEYEIEKIKKWLNKIEQKDYFNCEKKQEVLHRIEKCIAMLNEFSQKIFELNDNN